MKSDVSAGGDEKQHHLWLPWSGALPMLIPVTETNSAVLRNLKSSLGLYPCYRQTVKRCSASEVSSDTILDLQATLGSHLSLEQPNAAYSLPNTSKRLAEAAITYPIAFVKEQCKSSDDGSENRGEGIQKPLRNTKMEPIC